MCVQLNNLLDKLSGICMLNTKGEYFDENKYFIVNCCLGKNSLS